MFDDIMIVIIGLGTYAEIQKISSNGKLRKLKILDRW